MATVFLNGSFVSRDDARISAFDAGFQHGVGLFETMLAIRSAVESRGVRIVHLHEHLSRLSASARSLGLADGLRIGPLEEAVMRTIEQALEDLPATERFRIRLTITGGDLNLLERTSATSAPAAAHQPTLLIVASPATLYPAAMFETGVAAVIADYKLNPLDPFAGHKTLNYWARLRELQVAAAKRAGEALVFQVTNFLAGGCVSNAILVKGRTLTTPIAQGEEHAVAREQDESRASEAGDQATQSTVMPSPVLPGITRRWVLDWAEEEGLTVERRMVRIDDVLAADELLLTNSSWGVLPIVALEREKIGTGEVGPIAKRLRHAWSGL